MIVYIDGFNLYNGLKARFGRRYLWLDPQRLSTSLLKPDQELVEVIYFTTRLRDDPGRRKRQADYLSAVAAECNKLTVVEGQFKARRRRCRTCGTTWLSYEEKETDVALASRMVADAARSRLDIALLVSADSDLCPAVSVIRRLSPSVRVIACFPPRRHSDDLRRVVDASFTVGEGRVRAAQFPETVVTPTGVVLSRPGKWS